jgi:hypothetical protein
MRLSGVDPGIIRELSGIYKPFIKAFKELISNSYDADAKKILVSVAPDYSSISVRDDGIGMTPFEFHEDFARLGGSSAWLRGGKSPGGRERIGYKGIGFLAVARYCGELHVESQTVRTVQRSASVRVSKTGMVRLRELLGDTWSGMKLDDVITIQQIVAPNGTTLREARDYELTASGVRFKKPKEGDYSVRYDIDCRGLLLRAVLDFDHLLGLEHRADLRMLDDFCSVTLERVAPTSTPYTQIKLDKLKDFVVRELSTPALKGKARNVAFKSGREQFFWRLARSAPILDAHVESLAKLAGVKDLHKHQAKLNLPHLEVAWRDEKPTPLSRPVFVPQSDDPESLECLIPVKINEGGLKAVGYIIAGSEVIYPAEFRGLSIRVRNVAIGDATFFGWESIASGPRKAALSQISGELMVLSGLEAADAINPGRESFYEENPQYRVLRRVLFGSEDSLGGLVGQATKTILDRIHVRSQVLLKINEARERRRTLLDISSAVSTYSTADEPDGEGLSRFFTSSTPANGLSEAKDVLLKPKAKLAGFDLESAKDLGKEYEIDHEQRRVRFDFDHDAWDMTTYLNGQYYKVVLKQGKPDHPICEFDTERQKIFVNWTHPVKTHMDDVTFLRSAILLRLSYHAAEGDANAMMNLALKLLAHRAE